MTGMFDFRCGMQLTSDTDFNLHHIQFEVKHSVSVPQKNNYTALETNWVYLFCTTVEAINWEYE